MIKAYERKFRKTLKSVKCLKTQTFLAEPFLTLKKGSARNVYVFTNFTLVSVFVNFLSHLCINVAKICRRSELVFDAYYSKATATEHFERVYVHVYTQKYTF